MDKLLHDLYSHQAWADAEHWRAIEACASALQDKVVRERLHHIHLVQHGFLSVVTGRPFTLTKPEDFSDSSLKVGVQCIWYGFTGRPPSADPPQYHRLEMTNSAAVC